MTDSTVKPSIKSLDNSDNDLDAMLDEAALALGGVNALQDDEDAIDRLLMDDGFDEPEELTQNVGIKERRVDDITLPEFDKFTGFDEEIEDFEESEIIQNEGANREAPHDSDSIALFEADEDEADKDALLGDDFAEIDDLDEFTDRLAGSLTGLESTSTQEPEQTGIQSSILTEEQGDDFLLANFDIMADSGPDPESGQIVDEPIRADKAQAYAQDAQAQAPSFGPRADGSSGKIRQEPQVSPATAADNFEKEALQQFKSDEELINRQQKKRMQEQDNKARRGMVLMYAALALASVSLITAISFGIQAEGAKTELAQLAESVSTLEQEVKTIAATQSGNDLSNINLAVEQLSQKVDGLAGQMGALGEASADSSRQEWVDVVNKQKLANKTIAELQHKIEVLEKRKMVGPAVNGSSDNVKPPVAKAPTARKKLKKAPVSGADWSVNLLALREQRQAKNKAAEFAKKGVPVEVAEVVVNKQTWYRLRVSGFSSQNEATAYAGRATKALGLNSVWVTKK